MLLSPLQYRISCDSSRFRVVIAGRRFGKTFLAINELAKFARIPDRECWYVAPTYQQGKQIIWEPLKRSLDAVRWIDKVNEAELSIRLVNGSIIRVRSADRPDRLRGIGLDFFVGDEFADWSKGRDTWGEAIRPALADRQGHAMLIGTPKGIGNWAKDMFDHAQNPDSMDWAAHQYTTIQGGYVPKAEIEAAMADLDPRTFRQEYEATFETYSGVIYYAFKPERNMFRWDGKFEDTEREMEPVGVGVDFNVDPICTVIGVFRNGRLYVIDEIEIRGSNTYELCDEILRRYPKREIHAFPDASGANRRTSGDSDHKIMRLRGLKVRAPRANPEVKDRINAVNSGFLNYQGENRLFISHKCRSLKKAVERHVYKENTRQPEKDSGFDHLNDALGYMVCRVLPIRRDKAPDDGKIEGWIG